MNIDKATPDLFAALAKAQAEVENATKGSDNPHFRSKYADLAEVLNTVRPVFAKHGIGILQSTGFDGSLVSVTTVLAHASGGLVSSVASCVPAKTDGQGIGAATTYLRRYSLAAMAGVAQEDDDGQAAAHNGKPAESAPGVFNRRLYVAAMEKFGEDFALVRDHLDTGDFDKAAEIYYAIPQAAREAVWIAPTKLPDGLPPMLTTEHRKIIHTNPAWGKARERAHKQPQEAA